MNEKESSACLPSPPSPKTVKLQMMCLTLKNHWLATNSIARIGSFSPDFRGSLVYSRAHSRVSREPRPGQMVQGSCLHNLSMPLLGSPCGGKSLKQTSNLKLLFQITHFFSSFSQHASLLEPHFVLMTLQVQESCFRKAALCAPKPLFQTENAPLSLSRACTPALDHRGEIMLTFFTPQMHCWLMCILLLSKIPSPFLQNFFPYSMSLVLQTSADKDHRIVWVLRDL